MAAATLSFCFAQAPSPSFSVPPVDAPDLAQWGKFTVGVRTLNLVNPGQPDVLQFDKQTGKAPLTDRALTVEVWYPAAAGSGAKASYEMRLPAGNGTATYSGEAIRDAAPATNQALPLVIVSHGYPGSRYLMTYLTENLASKGYVVAAIDHTDSVFGATKAFQSTLMHRAGDQWFVIEALAGEAGKWLGGALDSNRVAIVGYSMGGYGALASAGAVYSKAGGAFKAVPGGYLEAWTEGGGAQQPGRRARLKALVAIAPWGAQPPYNNWDAAGLAGLRIPSLFIVGDQDDISGYEKGVKRLFEGAVNSDRCMLVFENGRHNTGGNPPPAGALANFKTRESFDEPVWRKDRMTAINQHFVTAFLDLHVKGDETKRDYLSLAMKRSNEGVWGDAAKPYWKGFQKRWAVGLQWHCSPAGQAAK
jgi:predicted dienelactone hydrolase